MANTNRNIAGRFVVKLGSQTIHGASADEVIELLKSEGDDVTELFVIHRVTPEGHLELAGVRPDALTQRDCLMFSRSSVADARRDYDQILEYASASPPPCSIDMRFGHARSLAPSHIVILIFPSACQAAVGGWLNGAAFDPGDSVEASPQTLEAFESAGPQVVLSTILQSS
ncbi:MAG TPA: hypothetical protein P5081_00555 [Phycisphaerae bacterium]|nr:hypothetical protein [Phycisphaerae bacterium]HRW51344.1 hypothetical protein [Phycisphaerae bacterium]